MENKREKGGKGGEEEERGVERKKVIWSLRWEFSPDLHTKNNGVSTDTIDSHRQNGDKNVDNTFVSPRFGKKRKRKGKKRDKEKKNWKRYREHMKKKQEAKKK